MRVGINQSGALWAYDLGSQTRQCSEPGTEGRKACVFRNDTPHRLFWWAGWLGQSPTPLLERLAAGDFE